MTAPFTALRPWLRHLDRTGRLAIARPGTGLRFALTGLAHRLEGRQAALFPTPEGHAVPVIANVVVDRGAAAEALGVDERQLLHHFRRAVAAPLPWTEVKTAPAQEVVTREVDLLRQLPVPVQQENDAGPYITGGLLIARNPATGRQNVSIHRLQVIGPDRMAILILPRHLDACFRIAENGGQPLPLAIAIGVDPATLLASQAAVPFDQDELEIAGALHGRPLPVVKAITSDIRLPAEAEIVIEGRILPGERTPEGPFGEFPGYYGPQGLRQIIEVTAITHRRRPLYHTILSSGLEALLLGGIAREASLFSHLERVFPNIRDLRLTLGGRCRFHLVVKIDKREDGEPKNLIAAAFGSHYDIKQVVVVDGDIDIHDPLAVEWAVATRFQAGRDLVVVDHALGSKLDPSTADGIGAKMGLDATLPLNGGERFLATRIPGAAEMDVERLLDHDPRASLAALIGEE